MNPFTVIVVAAGKGTRFGIDTPKILQDLEGKPVLIRTLESLQHSPIVKDIVLVTSMELLEKCQELVKSHEMTKVIHIIPGGKERQHSVWEGLKMVPESTEFVAIQDGARPFISTGMLADCRNALADADGAIIGTKIYDTLKEVDEYRHILRTIPREALWAVQTPQCFRLSTIKMAYEMSYEHQWAVTDDASLLEKIGKKAVIVPGPAENIKITTPDDLKLACWIYRQQQASGRGENS